MMYYASSGFWIYLKLSLVKARETKKKTFLGESGQQTKPQNSGLRPHVLRHGTLIKRSGPSPCGGPRNGRRWAKGPKGLGCEENPTSQLVFSATDISKKCKALAPSWHIFSHLKTSVIFCHCVICLANFSRSKSFWKSNCENTCCSAGKPTEVAHDDTRRICRESLFGVFLPSRHFYTSNKCIATSSNKYITTLVTRGSLVFGAWRCPQGKVWESHQLR